MKEYGKIESIEEKSGVTGDTAWTRLALVIGGRIRSTFDTKLIEKVRKEFKVGDTIELESEAKGKFNTITGINHQEGQPAITTEKLEGPELPKGMDDVGYRIIKQSSLKEARAFVEFAIANELVSLSDDKQAVDSILTLADTFVQWVLS